jgi:hypothetical protein
MHVFQALLLCYDSYRVCGDIFCAISKGNVLTSQHGYTLYILAYHEQYEYAGRLNLEGLQALSPSESPFIVY